MQSHMKSWRGNLWPGMGALMLILFGCLGVTAASDSSAINPILGYSTVMAGTGVDRPAAMAVDREGNVYVTGSTDSRKLLFSSLASPVELNLAGSGTNAFVMKLSPSGIPLYIVYLGGNGNDQGLGIAVDEHECAYILGGTDSPDFPVTANALQPTLSGNRDFFIAKINAAGNGLEFCTYLGGSSNGKAEGNEGAIVLDSYGAIYITGSTDSEDFPVTFDAYQSFYGGGDSDAFVAKISPDGKNLAFATFLGGGDTDLGRSLALDSAGQIYVTGRTQSRDFPTFYGYQSARSGASADAYVVKLNPQGSMLLYATYLGGELDDDAYGIVVKNEEKVFVTGETRSLRFPVTSDVYKNQDDRANETTDVSNPNADIFLCELDTSLDTIKAGKDTLLYSSYVGGTGDDGARGIAINSAGNILITGYTRSKDFPVVGALQTSLSGGSGQDAFIMKMNPEARVASTDSTSTTTEEARDLIYATYLGGSGSEQGACIVVDPNGRVWASGVTNSPDFPSTQDGQTAIDSTENIFLSRLDYPASGPALPVITTGITLTTAPPYETSQEVIGEFTLMNQGGAPLVIKYLTIASVNRGHDLADFTWASDLALEPGETFYYSGSLTLNLVGTFNMQIVYQTSDGTWHSGLSTAGDAKNTINLSVAKQTSGSIAANTIDSSSEDDECSISFGKNTCTTSITWKSINATTDEIKVFVQDVGMGGTPVLFQDKEVSGSKQYTEIQGAPHIYRFTMVQERGGVSTVLASVDVTGVEDDPSSLGKAAIFAAPQSCTLEPGESACSTVITWDAQNAASYARVMVQDVGIDAPAEVFSLTDAVDQTEADKLAIAGVRATSQIQASPHRYIFTLYAVDSNHQVAQQLAAVEVTAHAVGETSNASGFLSVAANACEYSQDADLYYCSATANWLTREYVPTARVLYEDLDSNDGPKLLGRTLEGTATAPELTPGHRYRFSLFQVDANTLLTLATADVVMPTVDDGTATSLSSRQITADRFITNATARRKRIQ